jgi:hypothetical protein
LSKKIIGNGSFGNFSFKFVGPLAVAFFGVVVLLLGYALHISGMVPAGAFMAYAGVILVVRPVLKGRFAKDLVFVALMALGYIFIYF